MHQGIFSKLLNVFRQIGHKKTIFVTLRKWL
nr:MAG TPA: hypothetical protein [Caudoviricetes sp.]